MIPAEAPPCLPPECRVTAADSPPMCEAIDCERPADWAHADQFGAMYLCEFHGGAINVEGWARITRENRDAE